MSEVIWLTFRTDGDPVTAVARISYASGRQLVAMVGGWVQVSRRSGIGGGGPAAQYAQVRGWFSYRYRNCWGLPTARCPGFEGKAIGTLFPVRCTALTLSTPSATESPRPSVHQPRVGKRPLIGVRWKRLTLVGISRPQRR